MDILCPIDYASPLDIEWDTWWLPTKRTPMIKLVQALLVKSHIMH